MQETIREITPQEFEEMKENFGFNEEQEEQE